MDAVFYQLDAMRLFSGELQEWIMEISPFGFTQTFLFWVSLHCKGFDVSAGVAQTAHTAVDSQLPDNLRLSSSSLYLLASHGGNY